MERVLIFAMAAVFLAAFLHNPAQLGQRIYATLNFLLLIVAMGIGIRHVWIQHLPANQVPECGVGLEYMLETMPLMDALKVALTGSGECAEIKWTFLGLSIPEQTILLLLGLALLILIQLFRSREA
jgi:disulfide bond formation protein DsbB